MTGSVLTSSTSAITDLATAMLEVVAPGTEFVPNSIRVTTGEPIIGDDGSVAYQATASGRAFDRQLDRDAVKRQVQGKTVSEAHVILDQLGTATITLLARLHADPSRRPEPDRPEPHAPREPSTVTSHNPASTPAWRVAACAGRDPIA